MVATRTSNITARDFQRMSPFRKPDSMWTRTMILFQNRKRPECWEDPTLKLAFDYIRAMDAADSDAKRANVERRIPDVAAALGLQVEAGPTRDELEARLLAGESFDAIAGKIHLPMRVIEVYEKLFYNVSESLRATDRLAQ